MPLSRTSLIRGFSVLAVATLCAVIVYVEFTSLTGYYARKHADLAVLSEEGSDAYTSLDGAPVTLTGGGDAKFTIINVWATWSPLSPKDFGLLDAIKQKYGDQVSVKAVNRKETKETARAYLSSIGAPDSIEYIIDSNDSFFVYFDGYAMPETIVFDSIGNPIFHKRGSLIGDELERVIDEYVQK